VKTALEDRVSRMQRQTRKAAASSVGVSHLPAVICTLFTCLIPAFISTAGKAAARLLSRAATLRRLCRWVVFPLLTTAVIAGCINTPLPDYYVLTPETGQVDLRDKMPGIAVGIGPITIPETLNRSNIVTPRDSNQLVVAEYHRWSEPLRDNISRILITNLAARTSLDKLYAYPWLGNDVDYQLRVDVLQMTGNLEDSVYLQVRWQVLTGTKPAKIIRTRIRDYREPVQKESYSSMVAAYSRTFATMTDNISTDLAEISLQ